MPGVVEPFISLTRCNLDHAWDLKLYRYIKYFIDLGVKLTKVISVILGGESNNNIQSIARNYCPKRQILTSNISCISGCADSLKKLFFRYICVT